MAKFQVTMTRNVQETVVIEVSVTKAEIVEGCDLEGEERDDWRDYAEDWISMNVALDDEYEQQQPNVERDTSDEWEVDEVNE